MQLECDVFLTKSFFCRMSDPGVAVRILIDLEVHHILFSSISEDLHTFFKFTELLVSGKPA